MQAREPADDASQEQHDGDGTRHGRTETLPMFKVETNAKPSCSSAGALSRTTRDAMPIPARVKVATIGTAMRAIRSCLRAVVAIFSPPGSPTAGPRFDGGRMRESEAENFETRLIYP